MIITDLEVCDNCGTRNLDKIGVYPDSANRLVSYCRNCMMRVKLKSGQCTQIRHSRKLNAYVAKWPNGVTEYFGRDLIVVDYCKEPLMIEPNANKKAVKAAKVKHSNLTLRTRDAELMILRAFYDSLQHVKLSDSARIASLVSLLKEHPWTQTYIRAALDPNRIYRLQSAHLKKIKKYKPNETHDSIFVVLTGLQFNKYEPMEAAMKWRDVLDGLQPEGHTIANMILDKQFCGFSRKECNAAMTTAGIIILIPRKKTT